MPLSQWFETEKGIVQTQETGDVTLTSKLLNHQRTLGRYQENYCQNKQKIQKEMSLGEKNTPCPAE